MPLNAHQVRGRFMMYGNLVSIVLRKRGHDQAQGTTVDFVIPKARQKRIPHGKETFDEYLTADTQCVWQIWKYNLDAGNSISPNIADQIVYAGKVWTIETITNQLFEEVFNCNCRRLS